MWQGTLVKQTWWKPLKLVEVVMGAVKMGLGSEFVQKFLTEGKPAGPSLSTTS